MNMKKILIYIIAIFSIGVYISGCEQLEDYESSEVLSRPTAELSVSAVGDSSFTLGISTDMAGYLGYALASDTSRSVTEAISILSLSLQDGEGIVANEAYEYSGSRDTTINVKGLMPNTYYKVFAASNNVDGVESEVQSYLFKTNDGVGPSFVSSSPAVSNEAAVSVGSDIVLTFDEPVMADTNKVFTFTYYFEGETEGITVDEDAVSGNTITVPQPRTGHAGDYFFLSWEEGAVTDLSGNPCDERVSGVVGGSLRGNFYRFEYANFSVADKLIVPENDSVLAAHDFVVDISFPFEIDLEELTDDMVKFRYSNWLGTVTTEVSAAGNCEIVNDTTLRITQPHVPANGDNIALYLAEGVLSDNYGNLNAASDYEISWTLGDFTIPEDIEPASGSVVTSQLFDVFVTFDFPISVIPDAAEDVITMTYIDANGSENVYNVSSYFVHPENDSILVIQTPMEVSFGSTVVLNIAEAAVQDAEGNVNLELQEEVYWEVPKLAESIDVLIGQYVVSGASYWDPYPVVTDTVTIELNEGTPNSVIITGLFKSVLGVSEPVTGTYYPENSLLEITEQQVGTSSNYIFTVFSDVTEDYAIRSYVLEDGTMECDLALGAYYHDWSFAGYFEYLPSVTWTKISSKAGKVSTKSGTVVSNPRIKEIPKRIK
jgi:hypothetical protein